jgi:hypothetical protein
MADGVYYVDPGAGMSNKLIGVDFCTVNGVANTGVSLGKIGFGDVDAFNYVTSTVGLPVNLLNASIAVTAASLPLPTGAATSALQSSGNTSLNSIDTKTPALGQALSAASVPVVLPAAQITALTPPAAITGFALETGGNLATIASKDFATQTTLSALNGKVTACNTGAVTVVSSALPTGAALDATIASMSAKIPALGQAVSASSLPVVLPASQITTLTPPAAITGFALETGGNLATIAGKDFATQTTLSSLNGKVTACNTGAVVLAAGAAAIGSITNTSFISTGAAASGAAKSGNPVQVGAVFNTTQPTVTTGQVVEAQATARGAKIVATGVDTFNVTVNTALPAGANTIGSIANTSFAATQSGAWNITNISGTVSLPTGAATAAKQPAIGTAGSASTDVITIQGIASATPVIVNQSQVNGNSVLTGNGTTGTGSPRVTIASDNTPFSVNAYPAGDTINISGTSYTVKRAFVLAASGTTTVVGAVASKQIRVLGYSVGPVSAAVNVYFTNPTAGVTGICSTKYLPVNGGLVVPMSPYGWFQTTAVNEALQIVLSATANVGVDVTYIEV